MKWYKNCYNKIDIFEKWINVDDVEYKWSGRKLVYREPGKESTSYGFVFSGDPEDFAQYAMN